MLVAFDRLETLLARYPLRGIKGPVGTAQDMLDLLGDATKLAALEQRVADHLATEEISIGDFVLSGGEAAALAIIDATVRLSFGFRYAAAGPIVQKEHSGWDTTCAVAKIIWPDLTNADGPPPILQKNVDEGRIGFKTKRGFFEWDDESIAKERARYERALRKCLEIFREEGIV